MKAYVDYVYDIVKNDTQGFDAIYKDAIIRMVGVSETAGRMWIYKR